MNVLPALRDELVRAAARPQAQVQTSSRPLVRRGLQSLPALAALAVAGVIAVVAVTDLHHRAGSRSLPTSAARPSVAVNRLVGDLAILRSPMTKAAQDWLHSENFRRLSSGPAGFRIVRSLVRTLSLPDHERLTLYVVASSRHGGTGLGFMERGRSSGEGECCITASQLLQPSGPGPLHYQSGRIPPQVYFEIVPDRVSKVRWTFANHGRSEHANFPRHHRRTTPSRGYIADLHSAPLTVTVAVHHNVAAMKLPNRGAATVDLWLNSAGKVIARHRTH